MTTSHVQPDFFYRALAAGLMVAPFLLLFAACSLPGDGARGQIIVYGHEVLVVLAVVLLALRAAYVLGFSRAQKMAAGDAAPPQLLQMDFR
jgi:hypothetical protein